MIQISSAKQITQEGQIVKPLTKFLDNENINQALLL